MQNKLKEGIANNFINTELGFQRIKKNLNIVKYSDRETELYLRKIILSTPLKCIETKGKNHYFSCSKYNTILTINSYTLTVITAKQINKFMNKNIK